MRHAIVVAMLVHAAGAVSAAAVPADLLQSVRAGEPVDVIVELDSADIDRESAALRLRSLRRIDDDTALERRARLYGALKNRMLVPLRPAGVEDVLDYRHLPLSVKRVRSEAALRALAALAGVRTLHADRLHQRVLAESLPLIGQPAVDAAGLRGTGTTVAVIDDGIDLAQGAFGGCTAVATPASCRVVAMQAFVGSPATNHAHGTNVAAIITGTATEARVASLNVFNSSGAPTSAILNAIDWAITHRSSLNIVAINMSLGDTSHNTSPCGAGSFVTSIASARNAGISVVVAAGNNAYENGVYVDGLSSPACSPGAISVGAVYDSAVGGLRWSGGTSAECTDFSTAADQVACFSNDAGYLSLLAPGARIAAGGQNFGGTSQAAPHVAGALAVLRAGYPIETLAGIESRLSPNGTGITDPRTGRVHARLNLRAAARPANDDLSAATAIGTAGGSAAASNRLATLESGEPLPAPGVGGSVWWRWTAPAAGQLSLDTTGSSFDTQLDVYTGSSLQTLVRLAGNDDAAPSVPPGTSSLRFQAQAGSTYFWAVEGASNGAGGDVSLQWSLNTAAAANLSVHLSGPAHAVAGTTGDYTLTVTNAGPQWATGVVANVVLPAGFGAAGLPAGCLLQGSTITCTVAELASGAATSFMLSLRIDSLDAPVTLTASLSSDLPDPAAADNTAMAAIAPAGAGDADIPTLPPWGVLLLGGVLLWRMERPRPSPL